MVNKAYQLNFCIWQRPDGSKLQGFCMTWQTASMSAPAFDYLDNDGERIRTGKYIGRRITNRFIMEWDRPETWGELKPNLQRLAEAIKR